jgi:dTDP-glucose 4,6-dehydratase
MRVLLSGAGGFVGHHVCEHLMKNTDWHVVATDSFRHKGNFARLAEICEPRPEWRERIDVITHDLTAPLSPQAAERIGPVDYVIAMASESHVDRSIADPVPFVKNNVDVALNTLEFCRQARPAKIIVVSTDEVYGPETGGRPHAEWAPVIPSNPYSASKACQEAIAVSYWRSYGLPVIITNTMNIFGERQDPEKFVPKVIAAVRDGRTVPVHGVPGNIGTRYYLHARNAADAWLYLLQHARVAMFSDGAPQPARFNVVGDEKLSNLELAAMIAGIMGRELRYELVDFHSTRPGHDPHYGLDGSRLWFHGWKAPLGFAESLRKTVEWTLSNPRWLR